MQLFHYPRIIINQFNSRINLTLRIIDRLKFSLDPSSLKSVCITDARNYIRTSENLARQNDRDNDNDNDP